MNYNGEKFLFIIYKDFIADEVDKREDKEETKEIKGVPQDVQVFIRYMRRLERLHSMVLNPHKDKIYTKEEVEIRKNRIKRLYYDKYVIKRENLPRYLSEERKKGIIFEQEKSLEKWIDYLTDENAIYPMWAKYWVFREMLKMGTYDEISGKYTKRSKTTINPFIEVNPEIIAKCIDNVMNLLGNEKQSIQQLRKKVGDISFERMYIEYQRQQKEQIKKSEGRWVKYNQGNIEEAKKLAKSLDGYDTKWCTAGETTAINQVCGGGGYPGGDFYVYYTLDENNEYKIPRIAMRLYGHSNISEIRGIKEHQNLEEEMLEPLEIKLKSMSFLKKENVEEKLSIVSDLRNLAQIKEKTLNNIPLTSEELVNLYTKKYGFGWVQDPLVDKIKSLREKETVNDIKTVISKIPSSDMYSFLIRILQKLDLKFDGYREIALEAVRQAGYVLEYVNPKVEGYREIVLEAVRQSEYALQYVDSKLEGYKEIALEVVRKDGCALEYVDSKAEGYREIALEAVKQNMMALEYVDSNVEGYKEIALVAINKNIWALQYVDSKKECYREIALETVKKNGFAIRYVNSKVEGYEEIALEAVRQCGVAIEYVDSKVEGYREIALEAVRQCGVAIEYVDSKVKGYSEIALEAVKQDGWALQYIDSKVEGYSEIALEAVKQDGWALQYVDSKVEGYSKIAIEAIKRKDNAIKYVDLDHVDLSNKENRRIILEAKKNEDYREFLRQSDIQSSRKK